MKESSTIRSSQVGSEFSRRVVAQLGRADANRARRTSARRWSLRAIMISAPIFAVCVAIVPWTFGAGIRTLISAAGNFTDALTIANRINAGFLSYLGLSLLPLAVDVMLLVGVVSWLVWVARAPNDTGEMRYDR